MRELEGSLALRDRCLFQLTGEDRLRYLNGQVTNDVRKASAERAVYACVTTAKGKVEADVFVAPAPDGGSLWVDGPGELREALQARLEKYIIADDVAVEDFTDRVAFWHVLGGAGPEVSGWKRRANRFGVEGWDVLRFPGEAVAWEGSAPVDPEAVEELRIAQGVARWGRELGPEVFPQEAGLEERALDFHKGCYIGQEVISRIRSAGKVHRELRLILPLRGEEMGPRAGDGLWAGDQPVGQITSVSQRRRFPRMVALGYVKRGHGDPGAELTCRGSEPDRICRVELRLPPLQESID